MCNRGGVFIVDRFWPRSRRGAHTPTQKAVYEILRIGRKQARRAPLCLRTLSSPSLSLLRSRIFGVHCSVKRWYQTRRTRSRKGAITDWKEERGCQEEFFFFSLSPCYTLKRFLAAPLLSYMEQVFPFRSVCARLPVCAIGEVTSGDSSPCRTEKFDSWNFRISSPFSSKILDTASHRSFPVILQLSGQFYWVILREIVIAFLLSLYFFLSNRCSSSNS